MAFEFKEASDQRGYLKVLLYAGSGGGKTLTSLKVCTALGRTLVIDSENGSGGYAPIKNQPREGDLPPFWIYNTKSVIDVNNILLQIERTKEFDCVLIDSGTHFWESCTEVYLQQEKRKLSKIYQDYVNTGRIDYGGWAGIKKHWRMMERLVLDIPCHVFMTARLKVLLDQTTFVKLGEMPSIEKDTAYAFSILGKMERSHKGVILYIENDKLGILGGKNFKNPDVTVFQPVIDRLNKSSHTTLPPAPSMDDVEIFNPKQELLNIAESILGNINSAKGEEREEEHKKNVDVIDPAIVKIIKEKAEKAGIVWTIEVNEKVVNLTKVGGNSLFQSVIMKDFKFFNN